MIKKLFLLVSLFALTFTFMQVQAQPEVRARISAASTASVEPVRVERTVYITRTGAKYHRSDCRYLSQSKIPVKLSVAIEQGYEPCKVCRP